MSVYPPVPPGKRRHAQHPVAPGDRTATLGQGRVVPLTPRRAENADRRRGWPWEMPQDAPNPDGPAPTPTLSQTFAVRLDEGGADITPHPALLSTGNPNG